MNNNWAIQVQMFVITLVHYSDSIAWVSSTTDKILVEMSILDRNFSAVWQKTTGTITSRAAEHFGGQDPQTLL